MRSLRIGITFDLVPDARPPSGPDDRYEEFDNPGTIAAIAAVLDAEGHEVSLRGDGREFLAKLLDDPPDFVWNMAEGAGVGRCREARVPAVLELLGIPHNGSDPLTLAACLDKQVAKTIVQAAGVAVPPALELPADTSAFDARERIVEWAAKVPAPWLLKPSWEGSSKGIRHRCLVDSVSEASAVFQELSSDYEQTILLEEYIAGDEVTVGILGNGAGASVLGQMQIVPNTDPSRFVYSLERKRVWDDGICYEVPPRLAFQVQDRLADAALTAYRALGCRDVARIDFRVRDDTPYFLEANPLPGLVPEWSDLVILAGKVGLSHGDLIRRILDEALVRVGLTTISTRRRRA